MAAPSVEEVRCAATPDSSTACLATDPSGMEASAGHEDQWDLVLRAVHDHGGHRVERGVAASGDPPAYPPWTRSGECDVAQSREAGADCSSNSALSPSLKVEQTSEDPAEAH